MNGQAALTFEQYTEEIRTGAKICCLLDCGIRCSRHSGRASFCYKRIKFAKEHYFGLSLDPEANHNAICDYHKDLTQRGGAMGALPKNTMKANLGQRAIPQTPIQDAYTGGNGLGADGMPDLSQLSRASLERYKKHYKIKTYRNMRKAEMVDTVAAHFQTIPVDELDVVSKFLSKVLPEPDSDNPDV